MYLCMYAYDTKVETSYDNHSNIHILSYFPNLLISSYTSFKIALAQLSYEPNVFKLFHSSY